jgi:hypothetical protein
MGEILTKELRKLINIDNFEDSLIYIHDKNAESCKRWVTIYVFLELNYLTNEKNPYEIFNALSKDTTEYHIKTYLIKLQRKLIEQSSNTGQNNVQNNVIGGRKSRRNINANKSKRKKTKKNHRKSKTISAYNSKSAKYHKTSHRI